ncbi:MAG: hypothetical protein QF767_10030, partial [Alphaproteobacteria bacterium]|nr:hypothetical protein [Alphaproteobacteria bacterium]
MIPRQAGASGDGLGYGHVVALGKRGELALGQRIMHAAAGDDQRRLGAPHQLGRGGEFGLVGARAADAMNGRFEKCLRVVEGLALRVLRKPEKGGPAIARIEHGGDRLGQGF